MIDWLIKIWYNLPASVRTVLVWFFDKQLEETLTILGAILIALAFFYKRIIRFIRNYRNTRNLVKNLPDFLPAQVHRSIKYYIWPECQSVDPAQSDEISNTIAVRNDFCSEMDRLLIKDLEHKHFFLLADTGMGKTSFLLNYFARHLRRIRKPYKMTLLPLNVPKLKERLKKISNPAKTILLLDAFDEDVEAIRDHIARLSVIMELTRDFKKIVITCRTQFFPRDEEIPVETGLLKSGPRKAGEGPQFTYYKIYLAPFSDEQVLSFLKRRFPVYQRKKRQKAQEIVRKIPNLAVRPMLLAYIEDLLDTKIVQTRAFDLYAQMVDAWLVRESRKGADSQKIRLFSEKLAHELFTNRDKYGGERIPRDQIAPLASQFGIELETWQLAGRSLLNRDALGNYKFAHRSILEFLISQKLAAGDPAFAQIPHSLLSDQIKTFLLEGIDKHPSKLSVQIRYSILSVPFEGGEYTVKEANQKVILAPFSMAMFPVTNLEYEEFNPSHKAHRDKYSDQDDQPVVYVSWQEAVDYCAWLSEKTGALYRLPTEAEWEYAASGAGKREYPWGNEPPSPKRANYEASKIGGTTPVGTYSLGRTPEGLYDMAGNVWEWCVDWYDKEQKYRVVRGGSFSNFALRMRCSDRNLWYPAGRLVLIGFRVVRGPQS